MHLKEKFQKSKINFQNVKKLTAIVANKTKNLTYKKFITKKILITAKSVINSLNEL